MRIYVLTVGIVAALGALILALGIWGLSGENAVSGNMLNKAYNSLVRSSTQLYPVVSQSEELFFTEEDFKQLTRNQRSGNMASWQEFMVNTEEAEPLANALSYFAMNHYANAGDFIKTEGTSASIESIKEAISALTSAIVLVPGDAESGYSKIEWERRRFLESAYIVLARAEEKEQEKQEQEQQIAISSGPTTRGETEEAEDPQDDLPVLVPGKKRP